MRTKLPIVYRLVADIFTELDFCGFDETKDFGAKNGVENTWYVAPKAYQYLLTKPEGRAWLDAIGRIANVMPVKWNESLRVSDVEPQRRTGLQIAYVPSVNENSVYNG